VRIGNSSQGFAVAVVDVPFSHGRVDDALELMGKTVEAAVAEAPLAEDVLDAPQVLGVEKVTSEGITLRLTVKVRPGRQWATQRALRARIMGAFVGAGIEPPFVRTSPKFEEERKPVPARPRPTGFDDSKSSDLGS
jgi:small-conductance mechanosensitive channel